MTEQDRSSRADFDLPSISAPEMQDPARLNVAPPLPEALEHGLVVIQYRADNLRIVPVFGPAALSVTPRIGHIHPFMPAGTGWMRAASLDHSGPDARTASRTDRSRGSDAPRDRQQNRQL